MTELPLITIITPNWNTPELLLSFLETVKVQTYPLNRIEVILIDNGSVDNSTKIISNWLSNNQLFFKSELVTLNKNYGIATAYNEGFKKSTEDSQIIIRTESDVVLEKDCITNLVKTLIQDDSIGLVGAKGILFSANNKIDHAARYINWKTGTLIDTNPDKLVECDCVFGGTFAINKNLIQKIGYFFKPDRFLASEMELCTRVKLAGFKVVCNPFAVSFHKVGNTTGKMNKKKFSFIDTRELTLFHLEFNKSLNKLTSVLLIFISSIIQLFKSNTFALRGFLSAVFSALFNRDVLLPIKKENDLLSVWLSAKN